MFPYSGGKAISTPEVTVENVSNSDPKMSNRDLPRPKGHGLWAEENFIHVDILWPRFLARRSYELVALLVVNQRAPNCENDRDPGAGRKVLEELAGANVCPANRD